MVGVRLDGKVRSQELLTNYTQAVTKLHEVGVQPKLVVVTVGEDPASQVYVGQKEKKSKQVGMAFDWIKLNEDITQNDLLEVIQQLNEDDSVTGFIIQLPLPKHINDKVVTEAISPSKDVDGFHPYNIGKMVEDESALLPCTPRGIMHLLDHYQIELEGKDVTVVGRSQIVGKPIAIMLIQRNATVTVAHSRTKNLSEKLKRSDIVIAAVGKAHLIKEEDLKEGAVVIDVGINRLETGKLVGDVDYEGALNKVAAITPVPGGVGPMTVAMLIEQTLICACMQNNLEPANFIESASI